MATERLLEAEQPAVQAPATPIAPLPAPMTTLLEEISGVIFKLRAFSDSASGDLGYGVELGMQRAADMIEHVLSRHESEDAGLE